MTLLRTWACSLSLFVAACGSTVSLANSTPDASGADGPDSSVADGGGSDAGRAADAAPDVVDGGSVGPADAGPCTNLAIQCADGSTDDDCAIGSKVVVDTSGPAPQLDASQRVVLTEPAHVAPLAFVLDGEAVNPKTHSLSCTLDGNSVPCASGTANIGPIADLDEHLFRVAVTALAANETCFHDELVVSAPKAQPTTKKLSDTGSYMLTSPEVWEIGREDEHVFIGAGVRVDMPGQNYCFGRTSPAACRVVVDSHAFFNIAGSNVNTTSNEVATIALGAESVTVIRGANFRARLRVVPGARIYQWGSNLNVKDVSEIAPFTLASCPFSATGACPTDLVTL